MLDRNRVSNVTETESRSRNAHFIRATAMLRKAAAINNEDQVLALDQSAMSEVLARLVLVQSVTEVTGDKIEAEVAPGIVIPEGNRDSLNAKEREMACCSHEEDNRKRQIKTEARRQGSLPT